MAEQFCLKWNNHQSTLISNFDSLLETQKHVDCSLAADGKVLRAHKVVLSACSPYLEQLLNHEKDRYPVLVFSDVRYDYLKAMLDYMYRGEVNVLQEHLNGFLKAAETLQIKGLTDQGGGGGGGEKRKGGGMGMGSPIGERSNSPTSLPAKRRRQRRPSLESDVATHDSSNSCDNLPPVAVAPSPSLQASSKIEQPEPPLQRVSVPPPAPAPPLQPKLEPGVDHSQPPSTPHQTSSLVIQPKTEFIEEATDEQIEDLTLDDDDDDSYMAKPGSSSAHGNDSQGFDSTWQFSNETSNPDMFLSTQQDPSGNQNNSQGHLGDPADFCKKALNDRSGKFLLCNYCPYRCAFLSHMKSHYNHKHNKNPVFYRCQYCDYKAKHKWNVQKHIVFKHKNNVVKTASKVETPGTQKLFKF